LSIFLQKTTPDFAEKRSLISRISFKKSEEMTTKIAETSHNYTLFTGVSHSILLIGLLAFQYTI